jgi:hypothetical protein
MSSGLWRCVSGIDAYVGRAPAPAPGPLARPAYRNGEAGQGAGCGSGEPPHSMPTNALLRRRGGWGTGRREGGGVRRG